MASMLSPGGGTDVAGIDSLRHENFSTLLDRLEKLAFPADPRLLEVGCSTGGFLEQALARGYEVHGIEASAAAAETAKGKGLSVECGFFPGDLADRGPFDIVVFNDVFEHLPSPSSVIREVERLLTPHGLVVLNLPSSDGILFRVALALDRIGIHGPHSRLWQRDFSSPHVSYFNPGNLRRMVERHSGLALRDEFALRTIGRKGLYDRVRSSHVGAAGLFLFMAAWCVSFVLPYLPPDIHVAVFGRPHAKPDSAVG
jgi:SAM-dependent methyltransferase